MLRPAYPDDGPAVAAVLIASRRVFLSYAPSAHTDEDVHRWVIDKLIPSGGVVVWEQSGAVVAVMATSHSDAVSWIDQMYVAPGSDGQGIGSKLLRHAHGHLRRPIRLYTFQQNIRARAFYERHGYKALEFTDGRSNEEKCPDVLYELSPP
ncbi:MAG: GNAT family N-acetyltransferase [Pirellula sp.]|nr:GNAT family N-acetyltransferase [Pirellula sp.]